MDITVTSKSVYGREAFYPACPESRLYAELAGAKTLTAQAISAIKRAGHAVIVANQGGRTL